MKMVRMLQRFAYRAKARVVVLYLGGETYRRVPEAAVRAILAARAGEIVEQVYHCCGIQFPLEHGKYGCPNCGGDHVARIGERDERPEL